MSEAISNADSLIAKKKWVKDSTEINIFKTVKSEAESKFSNKGTT